MKGYPKWFTPKMIHFIVAGLFVSGVFLVPTMLNARLHWDVEWRLTSDARIFMTFLHVLFGLFTFALLGALWAIHMRYWWRRYKGRASGTALVITFLILGVSGVGILYAGAESLVTGTAAVHTLVGLLFAAPYIWHTVLRVRLETNRLKVRRRTIRRA